MAKLIALEWDTHEARVAVASPRGNDLVVEQAFAVPLIPGPDDQAPTISQVGEQLAEVLRAKGLIGGDGMVALPRSSIELRTMTLPKAPPDEIPDMVRFQAMQAFTSIGDDWPLDFVELDAHDDSINVLAAVVSPKLVAQVQDVCAASDLKARRLVLRPFATVALLHRYESIDVFRDSLIVDMLPDGADLTVTSNGHVVFMRSVRLPMGDDEKAQVTALIGELRRTIGAAQNQMGDRRIEQIIICGDPSQHAALQQRVADALSLDVVPFAPFQAVRVTRQLKQDLPEDSGRFAPLLGMLASKATGADSTLDFLNPRKRPKPPSNKRRNVAVAVGVAVVLAVGAFVITIQKHTMDDEIARLTKESVALDAAVDRARNLVAQSDRIKVFTNGDITWLDEMREVATHLPDADHVILREISMGADRAGGGRMVLKGNVCSADVIAQLEQLLRYGDNTVRGKMGVIDRSNPDYPYQLNTTIHVPPDVQENGHSLGRPELDSQTKDSQDDAADKSDDESADESAGESAGDAKPANDMSETAAQPEEPSVEGSVDESESTPSAEPTLEGTPVEPDATPVAPTKPTPSKAEAAKSGEPQSEPIQSEPVKAEPAATAPAAKTEAKSPAAAAEQSDGAESSATKKEPGASEAPPNNPTEASGQGAAVKEGGQAS